jgi:hypothetical protein
MTDFAEKALVISLIVTNLAAGFGGAIPTAKQLRKINGSQKNFLVYYAIMLGIYFLECLSFAFGMCTQVFTIGMAIVWGAIFGLWLKGLMSKRNIIRQTLFISLYGCLPTVSFALMLLIFWVVSSNGLLNAEQAHNFGIPDFVPWPLDTMLGFCVALAMGTIILKTGLTTGIAALIVSKEG